MEPLTAGMTGENVRTLQAALVASGIVGGEPTGQFDQTTQRAVAEVQRRAGLPQTGVVDERTWSALVQMTASVQAGVDPVTAHTQNADPAAMTGQQAQPQSGIGGLALLAAVGIGLATYWAHSKARGGYGDDDEGDDEGDEEDDGEDVDDSDFQPVGRLGRRARLSDLDDAVTDSLIEEPARVASSRRPGDCKKAARMLLSRSGLAQRPGERSLFNNVVRKVANDCGDQKDAVQEAIDEEQEKRDDIADELDASGAGAADPEDRQRFPGEGFRKTKAKWVKKSSSGRKARRSEISPGERDLLDVIARGTRGAGRKGAGSIRVKKRGGEQYRIRKEKAKTRRGYTWRKE